MNTMRTAVVLLLATLVLAGVPVRAFKPGDFKRCDQASFCDRLRTGLRSQDGADKLVWSVDPATRKVSGPTATFVLTPTGAGEGAPRLPVTLTMLRDNTFRLHVAEEGRTRYEVQSVLMPLTQATGVATGEQENGFYLEAGVAKAVVHLAPFSVDFYVNDEVSVSIGAEQLFHIETKTEPAEGQTFEERFNNHLDTRKKGPEGLSFDALFADSMGVYGIPERAMALRLPSTRSGAEVKTEPYRMYNLDVFEYEDTHPFGLYGSIPFMVSHGKKRSAGLFWLNASEMWVDVDNRDGHIATQWIAESGVVDLFVTLGPKPADVFRQYGQLTGNTYLPPLFSLGYHQCRWNYRDEADVAAVDAGFEEHEMPYDVLWLDIEHTDGKKYFTWDQHSFPTPVDMQNKIAAKRRKMVTIIDPHIKRDNGYYIYSEALSRDLFVKNRDGNVYEGHCWPGGSSYLDFTSQRVRDWWADQYRFENYKGSTENLFTWNDMNEPSVFNGPETTMQKDNLHDDGKVEHRDVHNIYGYLYHMASVEGQRARTDDRLRPFILSRAFFAGTQRYGPIWTGDNAATWGHLRASYPMVLSVSVAGLPFVGADVGGFFGNPDAELQARWYQAAVFYPFFRGHAHLETKRREPWLFGEPYTSHIRAALRARYQLLPYLYTTFYQSHISGMPVARPLWSEFPEDEQTYGIDDEMMLGNALLSKVVAEPGATKCPVYLPQGSSWYQLTMGQSLASKDHLPAGSHEVDCALEDGIPVFQRSGTIVARRDRPRRSSAAMDQDPYTLYIALDESGSAQGALYIDDGATTHNEKRKEYVYVELSYQNGGLHVKPKIGPGVKQSPDFLNRLSHVWVEKVVVMDPTGSKTARRPELELIHEARFALKLQ